MAKPYSLDLRQKVHAAWQAGGATQEQVARRFGVSESFVRDLARRFRERGSVAAKGHGGGRAPSVGASARAAIESVVHTRNDATIDEHRASLAAGGHALSRSALGRALLALGLTHKKRRSRTMSAPPHG